MTAKGTKLPWPKLAEAEWRLSGCCRISKGRFTSRSVLGCPFWGKVPLLIEQIGWSDALRLASEPHMRADYRPRRIIVQQRKANLVVTDVGTLSARLFRRVRHEAREAGHWAAGAWVALLANAGEGTATIYAVLARRTAFVRRAADSVQTLQVIAANIDVVFVVNSMNAGLNPHRLERFLAAAWQSGARPVVVLTKADLCEQPEGQAAGIGALAAGCLVLMECGAPTIRAKPVQHRPTTVDRW